MARPQDRSKPFFLYLHATDPHSPYTPRGVPRAPRARGERSRCRADRERQERCGATSWMSSSWPIWWPSTTPRSPSTTITSVACSTTRATGPLDSTLIVLVSDHGEEFFDHGWWQHGKTLFQEQLGVPLIIRFPGGKVPVESSTRSPSTSTSFRRFSMSPVSSRRSPAGRSLRPLSSRARAAPIHAISYLDLDNRDAESVTSSIGKLILHHYDVGRSRAAVRSASSIRRIENLYRRRPVLAGYLRTRCGAFNLAQEIG